MYHCINRRRVVSYRGTHPPSRVLLKMQVGQIGSMQCHPKQLSYIFEKKNATQNPIIRSLLAKSPYVA